MEINGEYRLNGDRRLVWDTLNDPRVLEKTIPGVDNLIMLGEDHYRAEMSVGVGFVKGRFNGSFKISDKVPHESYRMVIEGKGAAGWVNGSGNLRLEETGPSETTVTVTGDATVGGMIGKVGQGMVSSVANNLMQQFFENVDKQVAARKAR